MDPITATSLAASIVTLVGLGVTLFSRAVELRQAPTGTSATNIDLNRASRALLESVQRIQASSNANASNAAGTNLLELGECRTAVANELLRLLDQLNYNHKNGKWEPLKKALVSVASRSKVDSLVMRLQIYPSQPVSRSIRRAFCTY